MIDPRTPVLIGAGQITDATGKPSSERSRVAFCAEAARAALADARASVGAEALEDPQVKHRGSLCTIEDRAGAYQSPAPPFRFSGSPLQSGPKVAALGEHTKSVLAEAGLSPSEIEGLVK